MISLSWAQDSVPDQDKMPLNEEITEGETLSAFEMTEEDSEEKGYLQDRNIIFDDRMLIEGYADKYSNLSKEILLEMIKDENLSSYKTTAAVKVFNKKFAPEMVSREKKISERILLRRLNRSPSPFVKVAIMHTLCRMDRYRYFNSMVPALIQKLDHYNSTVNDLAFESLMDIVESGNNRPREARIVFNTLRKVFFLSRRRLANVKEPGPQLAKKIKLLRWSIKVVGSEELRRLPKEVINLL